MCAIDASHCANCTKIGCELWPGLSSIRINLRSSMKNVTKMNSGNGGTRTVGPMYEARNLLSCTSVPWLQVIGINSKDHQHLLTVPKARTGSNFELIIMDIHLASDTGRDCGPCILAYTSTRTSLSFRAFHPLFQLHIHSYLARRVSNIFRPNPHSFTDIVKILEALWC